ncbi:hypothetical protein [Hymenobacter rigui]|uniref:Lipocalin-like domain-containing protein n=1 Tax=Hymenobacter rigui TaxID=334424 RepID=A0A428KNE3_9BACT|nr:hypothetical protein [Hymenobacter rigui]RSK47949.1 hypothetical protein EI291_12695 [Hymenobacter rigui]
MKYLYTTSLLSAALLLTSCGKDSPQPEPQLQGRWHAVSNTAYNFSASGQLISQEETPDNSYYLVITPDSMHYRDIRDGNSWGSNAYTRQGQEISYGRARATIIELTDHTLSLRFQDTGRTPGMPYQEVEDHYSR